MSTLKQGFGLMLQDKVDRKESTKSRGLHEFVGGVGAWVARVKFDVGGVDQKKGVSGVGQNFGMGRVGLRCFVKKVLLKVSQNLQESTCAGVSC